jgi:hypothetical protein
VLDLYLHRGSFETVLADEDQEQDPDRWVSHTPCGQEFWQIIAQWIWNLRLEFGQQVSATSMRLTEFAYAQIDEPVQASEPMRVNEPVKASEAVCYGPAQWAHRSFTKGFAGADFAHYPHLSLDLFFPRHFAVFLLHENVVAPLIACLLSSRCVSRGPLTSKNVLSVLIS